MSFLHSSRPGPLFLTALIVLSLTCFALGCRGGGSSSKEGPVQAAPWFSDVTEEWGLRFVHDAGPVGTYFMPQIMGSGGALLDFDNDGRLDVYLVQNAGPSSRSTNRLFRQRTDGRFEDVSTGSGLDVAGFGMGVAVGDVNNDGWPDVLLTEFGRTRFFLNQGNSTFLDITQQAGIDNPGWGTSACFLDYDRDGRLDLVIVNYLDYDSALACKNSAGRPDYCFPRSFSPVVPRLFHNLGSVDQSVRFEDVTLKSGLGTLPGYGLGVVCADFTGDHWPDILVANDQQANYLWVNQQNSSFKEEAVRRALAYNGVGQAEANMGIALGDVNADGLFDVLVTHLTEETHSLWLQKPRGMFQDHTARLGFGATAWRGTGFGTVLTDLDHDGALDAAVVTGRVVQPKANTVANADQFWAPYQERNQLLANDGRGLFRDISADDPAFCGQGAVARGLAYGDVDNDGAIDLLVTTVAGPARLYRNIAPKRGHWLSVRAFDPGLKRDAYGAEIWVHAGDRKWLGLLNPGSSYLCSNDPRVHFGMGSITQVDSIRVVWPDGREEVFPGGATDRSVILRKGEGKPS